MKDTQVFISFVNFYYYFIKSFSKIVISLISILKTLSPNFLPVLTKKKATNSIDNNKIRDATDGISGEA